MFRVPWRRRVVFLFKILFLGLFVWVGSLAVIRPDARSIQGYGGLLPPKTSRSLERMHAALRSAKRIIAAQPNRVRFVDDNETVAEYSFAYGTLWYNDYPVVSDVRAFHFEYRDGMGGLLVRAEEELARVETVGYTIRVASKDREVSASSRVKLPSVCVIAALRSEKQVALANVSWD